jgi:hypothetical protein
VRSYRLEEQPVVGQLEMLHACAGSAEPARGKDRLAKVARAARGFEADVLWLGIVATIPSL